MKKLGLDFVVRDSIGTVLVYGIEGENSPYESWMVEFRALKMGVQIAPRMGFSPLVLEIDALEIIQNWAKEIHYSNKIRVLIAEPKDVTPKDQVHPEIGFELMNI
ncbi:hypothetical protein Ancab_032294 [Ancistrocladus abbreviatus]